MVRMKKDERRRQLADLTLDIIYRKGLRRFTVAELAAAANISEGTVFRHFKSKEEIVEASISRMEEVLFHEFPPKDPDPVNRLGVFFRERLRLVTRNPSVAGLVFSEQLIHAAGKTGESRIMEMRKRSREFVYSCLHEAAEGDLLVNGINVMHLFFVVHGALSSMVSVLLKKGGNVALVPPKPQEMWEFVEKLIRR